MTIRATYEDLIAEIADQDGVDRRIAPSYLIPANASRDQCLRYALRYVAGHSTTHYRYDVYRSCLRRALQSSASRMQTARPLLHLDLGCGPGLFAWVVHDCLSPADYPAIRYYGYDHSREMVILADELWSELATGVDASWQHKRKPILSAVSQHSPPHASALVTFGHVLAQTSGQSDAINAFAKLICGTLRANSLIVAYDAQSAATRFAAGREALLHAVRTRGFETDMIRAGSNYFSANVTR